MSQQHTQQGVAHPRRDQFFTLQDRPRFPEVSQDMHNVTDDRERNVQPLCPRLESLNLVRIAVNQDHPVFRMLWIALQGLVKELSRHRIWRLSQAGPEGLWSIVRRFSFGSSWLSFIFEVSPCHDSSSYAQVFF